MADYIVGLSFFFTLAYIFGPRAQCRPTMDCCDRGRAQTIDRHHQVLVMVATHRPSRRFTHSDQFCE